MDVYRSSRHRNRVMEEDAGSVAVKMEKEEADSDWCQSAAETTRSEVSPDDSGVTVTTTVSPDNSGVTVEAEMEPTRWIVCGDVILLEDAGESMERGTH